MTQYPATTKTIVLTGISRHGTHSASITSRCNKNLRFLKRESFSVQVIRILKSIGPRRPANL